MTYTEIVTATNRESMDAYLAQSVFNETKARWNRE